MYINLSGFISRTKNPIKKNIPSILEPLSKRLFFNLTCDTLCIPIPPPETFTCHSVVGLEATVFHSKCKESLGEKCKSTCGGCTLAKALQRTSQVRFLNSVGNAKKDKIEFKVVCFTQILSKVISLPGTVKGNSLLLARFLRMRSVS